MAQMGITAVAPHLGSQHSVGGVAMFRYLSRTRRKTGPAAVAFEFCFGIKQFRTTADTFVMAITGRKAGMRKRTFGSCLTGDTKGLGVQDLLPFGVAFCDLIRHYDLPSCNSIVTR